MKRIIARSLSLSIRYHTYLAEARRRSLSLCGNFLDSRVCVVEKCSQSRRIRLSYNFHWRLSESVVPLRRDALIVWQSAVPRERASFRFNQIGKISVTE